MISLSFTRLAILACCILLLPSIPVSAEESVAEDESSVAAEESTKIRVLMMTGQNNHNWKKTTPALTDIINAGERFALTIDETPWEFGPDAFDNCDVVFSNWSVWPNVQSDPWNAETKAAFLRFIERGGGLVVFHAGSSVHYQWPEFQALVGATWRKGVTWHGPKHEFAVTVSAAAISSRHPITRGLKPFRIFDELWRDMERTSPVVEVLAVADTSGDKKKRGPKEAMLLTTSRGKGRAVNLVIGHDTRSLKNAGFQELLLRSLEWAATGDVLSSYGLQGEETPQGQPAP